MIHHLTLRRVPFATLVLVLVFVVIGAPSGASAALLQSTHPGYWAQTTCSEGQESVSIDGWRAESLGGYPTLGGDNDSCQTVGGSLSLSDQGTFDAKSNSGPEWVWEVSQYSAIVGGVVHVGEVRTPHSEAYITTNAFETPAEWLLACSTQCVNGGHPTIGITQEGGWQLWAGLRCLPVSPEVVCPSGINGELEITSATIMMRNGSVPSGTGFGGTLLDGAASGTANLSFTAHDVHGAGVYRVAAELDGQVVWSGTPSINEGQCVAYGSYDGALNFHSNQPCPQETGVNIEVPTTTLAEGQHELTVLVEDAAGNTATVYSGPVNIDNSPPPEKVVLAPLPPDRGACNGSPCDEAAKLIAAGQPTTLTRALGRSGIRLTGRLMSATSAPIKGAQVKLLQQIVGSATGTQIASTTTGADGSWSLNVPAGPSRTLEVAFYSHMLDTTPASSLNFHENVQGAVSMHAPRRARLGQAVTFTGQLVGGYVPAAGESVQVEIFYGGRWRTIEVLPTSSKGRWSYRYVFTLGVGSSYLFRAVTVPNGAYPYLSTHSRPVRVIVQR
jgi:hypothetical protein